MPVILLNNNDKGYLGFFGFVEGEEKDDFLKIRDRVSSRRGKIAISSKPR
ncbi:hypothetical protein [Hyella patelloides]|nr:hypothetical protein [Hyella patelloides]